MYEPRYEDTTGGGGFLMGLLCGTALGAAVGLMFAPKVGSEFRQTLAESTDQLKRKAAESTDQLKRKAADYYEHATEGVTNMVSKGRDAVDRGREAFETVRDTTGDRIKDTLEKPRGSTSDMGSTHRPAGVRT